MFEKEAEEYATENWEYYEEGKNDSKALKQAYQQGAEFGYNKARELIKEMLSILSKENTEGVYEITEKAKKTLKVFMKSLKKQSNS